MSPSQARNAIKRALKELLDPPLSESEKGAVWKHFQCQCAFCGTDIERKGRKGHLDHLVPESQGGRNALANRVLACHTCNGDEKLDADWKEFLRSKAPSVDVYAERLKRIESWILKHGESLTLDASTRELLASEFEKVNVVFSKACGAIRPGRSG